MARDDRRGKRKTREERSKRRVPEMGYYLVVTDTEATERLYFHGLHESLPAEVRKKLVIKVVETKTQKLVEKCKELVMYDPQYRIPWIVFDRDKVVDFDGIIRKAEAEGFRVGWSNPCFEIWLFGYFGTFQRLSNHGLAVTDSESFTKERPDRRMTRQMRSCITGYANTEMKKMRLNARI